jgi:Flp pilus assembly protein CpaB
VKNKKTTGLIAAIAFALIGLLLLGRSILGGGSSSTAEQAAPAAVAAATKQALVAKVDIPSGTPASALATMTETKDVPVDQAQDALTSLDAILDQVTNAQIYVGEPLRPSRFYSPTEASEKSIAAGEVGVSVWLDRTELPDGKVGEGDIVGLVGTFQSKEGDLNAAGGTETHLTIRKVRVVSVSAPVVPPPANGAAPSTVPGAPVLDPTGKQMVTLSVPDVDAERIVFLSKYGTITLVRETEESVEGGTKIVTRGNIYSPTDRRTSVQTGAAAKKKNGGAATPATDANAGAGIIAPAGATAPAAAAPAPAAAAAAAGQPAAAAPAAPAPAPAAPAAGAAAKK